MAKPPGKEKYVSRAGLKLAGVSDAFKLDFTSKIVLDVGSSTGGFTDYALQHGAKKVIAVEVGTNQLHPKLRTDPRVELHEKTDIRDFQGLALEKGELPTIILIDISFMSLQLVLPHIAKSLAGPDTIIIAMIKPQFEAKPAQLNKGIVKNEAIRRQILKDFEGWAKNYFVIQQKMDSEITGLKGNRERFFLLYPFIH